MDEKDLDMLFGVQSLHDMLQEASSYRAGYASEAPDALSGETPIMSQLDAFLDHEGRRHLEVEALKHPEGFPDSVDVPSELPQPAAPSLSTKAGAPLILPPGGKDRYEHKGGATEPDDTQCNDVLRH